MSYTDDETFDWMLKDSIDSSIRDPYERSMQLAAQIGPFSSTGAKIEFPSDGHVEIDYSYIWTLGGHKLHLGCSRKDYPHWDVGTIAHALSRQGRWSGHTRGSFAYSVAQHCVVVSYMVPTEIALEGLFHDAAEFVLSDVATPVKKLLPPDAPYRELTRRWDAAIAERFGLHASDDIHALIKRADNLIQHREGLHLVGASAEALREWGEANPKFGPDWGSDPDGMLQRLPADVCAMLEPLAPNAAKWAFLRRYEEICALRNGNSTNTLVNGEWELLTHRPV